MSAFKRGKFQLLKTFMKSVVFRAITLVRKIFPTELITNLGLEILTISRKNTYSKTQAVEFLISVTIYIVGIL